MASFVACIIVQARAPEYAFYLPLTRAWELLVGSGLALWLNGKTAAPVELAGKAVRAFREVVGLCALLAILVAVWRFSPKTPFPGYATLVPVLAAAALIGTSNTLVHRYVLASRGVVFVGLISYPLYLWHYPMMAYGRIHFADAVPVPVMSGILLASLLLSWLTYQFIERPIRFGNGMELTRSVHCSVEWLRLAPSGLSRKRPTGCRCGYPRAFAASCLMEARPQLIGAPTSAF